MEPQEEPKANFGNFMKFLGILSDDDARFDVDYRKASDYKHTSKSAMAFMRWICVFMTVFFTIAVLAGVTFHWSWLVSLSTLWFVLILMAVRLAISSALAFFERIKGFLKGFSDEGAIDHRLRFGIGTILGIAFTGLVVSMNPQWSTVAYIPGFLLFAIVLDFFDRLLGTQRTKKWQKVLAFVADVFLFLTIMSLLTSWVLPQTREGMKNAWSNFDSWLRDNIPVMPASVGDWIYAIDENGRLKEKLVQLNSENVDLRGEAAQKDEEISLLREELAAFRAELGLVRRDLDVLKTTVSNNISRSSQGITAVEGRSQRLSGDFAGMSRQISRLEDEVKSLRSEVRSELSAAKSANYNQIQSETERILSLIEARVGSAENRVDSFRGDMESLQEAVYILARALRDYDTENTGDKKKIRAAAGDAASKAR